MCLSLLNRRIWPGIVDAVGDTIRCRSYGVIASPKCSSLVGKKLEPKLLNKNILEYAQILVGSGRFMIFHIEGHSNLHMGL